MQATVTGAASTHHRSAAVSPDIHGDGQGRQAVECCPSNPSARRALGVSSPAPDTRSHPHTPPCPHQAPPDQRLLGILDTASLRGRRRNRGDWELYSQACSKGDKRFATDEKGRGLGAGRQHGRHGCRPGRRAALRRGRSGCTTAPSWQATRGTLQLAAVRPAKTVHTALAHQAGIVRPAGTDALRPEPRSAPPVKSG